MWPAPVQIAHHEELPVLDARFLSLGTAFVESSGALSWAWRASIPLSRLVLGGASGPRADTR